MAWEFLPPEWREMLRPKLDEAEAFIAAGVMTREQAEAIVRSMHELAHAELTGDITHDQAHELVDLLAYEIAGTRRAN